MNKKIILNHKSYLNLEEVGNYLREFENLKINSLDVVVFPSIIYLSLFKDFKYPVGTQNFYSYNYGNYTGEINLESLKFLGIEYTLLNHFERIKNGIDKPNILKEKVDISLSNDFFTILMVGESKKRKNPFLYIKKELDYYLKNIDSSKLKKLSILYEPYWKDEKTEINIDLIRKVVVQIKEYFISNYKLDIDVYYGSGVNFDNASKILEVCDGIAIGKDSSDIEYVKELISRLDK